MDTCTRAAVNQANYPIHVMRQHAHARILKSAEKRIREGFSAESRFNCLAREQINHARPDSGRHFARRLFVLMKSQRPATRARLR